MHKLLVTKLTLNEKEQMVTALIEEHSKKPLEISVDDLEEESLLGNIYVGRVQKVVKNLNAAFIEIGKNQVCYYSLEDYHHPVFVKKSNSDHLVQGDELLVQIQKDAVKTKVPTVTTNLNFPGKYMVLTTGNRKTGYSNKLNAQEKDVLKEFRMSLQTSGTYGMIFRTNARFASVEELRSEWERLYQTLQDTLQYGVHRTLYSCVLKEPPSYLKQIRGAYENQLSEIVTDREEVFLEIKDYLQQMDEKEVAKLHFYQDDLLPMSKLYSLESGIQNALSERVWLKSGAYLIIQYTEALSVIDINSGKNVAKKNPQENYLKINKEAAIEIAYQMRLRNLSGIIIIDFIDMQAKEARDELMEVFTQACKKDPVKTQVVDMTRLNLVEVTRKKVKKPLHEQIK